MYLHSKAHLSMHVPEETGVGNLTRIHVKIVGNSNNQLIAEYNYGTL